MSMLVWIMVGLAVWHFTIWLPDHAWGGIVGAFLGAAVGSALFGVLVNGFSIPGENDTGILSAFEAVPGAVLGIGATYLLGLRRERREADQAR